jgi:hypothetical protein
MSWLSERRQKSGLFDQIAVGLSHSIIYKVVIDNEKSAYLTIHNDLYFIVLRDVADQGSEYPSACQYLSERSARQLSVGLIEAATEIDRRKLRGKVPEIGLREWRHGLSQRLFDNRPFKISVTETLSIHLNETDGQFQIDVAVDKVGMFGPAHRYSEFSASDLQICISQLIVGIEKLQQRDRGTRPNQSTNVL